MPAATKPTHAELHKAVHDTAWKVMHTSQFPASVDQMIDEITDAVTRLYEDTHAS